MPHALSDLQKEIYTNIYLHSGNGSKLPLGKVKQLRLVS